MKIELSETSWFYDKRVKLVVFIYPGKIPYSELSDYSLFSLHQTGYCPKLKLPGGTNYLDLCTNEVSNNLPQYVYKIRSLSHE